MHKIKIETYFISILIFDKKMIPLTPVKLKFKNKYMISTFPKSTVNRVK